MILILDQSTSKTGYAIVSYDENTYYVEQYGCISFKEDELHKKIKELIDNINYSFVSKNIIEEVYLEDIQLQVIRRMEKGKMITIPLADPFKKLAELRGALFYNFMLNNILVNDPIQVNKWRNHNKLKKRFGMAKVEKDTLHKKLKEMLNKSFTNDVSDVLGLTCYVMEVIKGKKHMVIKDNFIRLPERKKKVK